jgi:hypothetical protein
MPKDGATLPPAQATERRAERRFDVGEIFDVTFGPTDAGDYLLDIRYQMNVAAWKRRITVR